MMPLMKAKTISRERESAIVMDLSDLEQQGSQIVAGAKAEAERIVAEAKAKSDAEAKKAKELAKKMGHAEGLEQGLADGQKSGHDQAVLQTAALVQDLVGRWSNVLQILQENMPVHVADARTDLIKLALAIAGRVTKQEALRNRNVAKATAEETLKMAGQSRSIVLHVHPEEMVHLEGYLPDLLAKLRTIESVELTPDETVTSGGCLARFGAGEIDAKMETQLKRVAEELLSQE